MSLKLQDLYCKTCQTETLNQVLESNWNGLELCQTCQKPTEHGIVCNGGCAARYRLNDIPADARGIYEYQKGRIKVGEITADQDGQPVDNVHTGQIMHSKDRFTGDKRLDKHDRIEQKYKRDRGLTPIFVDQGR